MNYTIYLSFNAQHDPEQEWNEKKRAALRAIQAVTMDDRFAQETDDIGLGLFLAEIELLQQVGDPNGSE
jgi:hypothetical protein